MSQAVSAIKSLSSVASPSEPSSLRSTPVDSEVALARAHRLLHLEAQAREQPNEKALLYHLVNESRNVLNFKLALLFRRPHINARARITLASSLAEVEADAPAIRYMEDAVHALGPDKDLTSPCLFTLSDETSPDSLQGCAHTALWVPVSAPSAGVAAGLVLLNDRPFSEGDTLIAKRIADTYGHAWAALSGAKRIVPRRRIGMLYSLLLMVAIVIGAFVPVPLAILAPAEVVSAQSAVVAAPLEGVLQSVEVEPNQRVSSGQLLARFDVTRLRNDLELAEQKVLVADAKSRRAAQGAIASMEAKREMAVAKAELALARTERDYAKDLLLQADLRAPMDGVAAFSDRRDTWRARLRRARSHSAPAGGPRVARPGPRIRGRAPSRSGSRASRRRSCR